MPISLPAFDVTGLSLNFNTAVNKVGNGTAAGNIVVFSNVITVGGQSIDAVVTTVAVDAGVSITSYDSTSNPYSSTGYFQPNIQVTNAGAGGGVTFKFEFIKHGTYVDQANHGDAVVLQNLQVNAYDIDSSGGSDRQYQEFGGFDTYTVGAGSTLAVTPNGSLTRFQATTSTNNSALPGTVNGDKYRIQANYNATSEFQAKIGVANAGGTAYFALDFSPGASFATPVTPATFSVNDVMRNEADGTMTFTVTRAGSTALASTVDYATANGTALAGSDYTATSGTLSFAAGETSKTVTVSIINDAIFEPTESFFLNLSNATNATISDAQGIGTILDDAGQGPGPNPADDRPAFSVNDVTRNEADGTMTFTVTKTGSTTLASTVNYATANGTALAGSDYTATSGTLSFAAGETSKTVTVSIINDAIFEPTESFFLNLSNATNATISDAQGIGTILDDAGQGPGPNPADDRPAFSVNDVTRNEADGTMTFTVTKTGSTTLASTVNYATANGTALANAVPFAVA